MSFRGSCGGFAFTATTRQREMEKKTRLPLRSERIIFNRARQLIHYVSRVSSIRYTVSRSAVTQVVRAREREKKALSR